MQLQEAIQVAENIVSFIKPYCSRIEIAGSIRRKKENVNDIELVAIPENRNMLFNKLGMELIKRNRHQEPFKKSGDKYRRFIWEGAMVDLFLATPENWGYIYAIRTGSADYSHFVLANGWVKKGFNGKNGMLYKKGVPVPVPEEMDLYNLIGIEYRDPEKREVK